MERRSKDRAGLPILEGSTVGKRDRDAGSKVEPMFFDILVIGNF